MFELMTAGEHTWYMSAPTNVGFYLHAPGKVCMIDVGDQTCAERALEHIRARGWELTALYLTHSHTDHVSGAAWLRNQTSCRVYAPGISAAAVKHSFLVATTLYGGRPARRCAASCSCRRPASARSFPRRTCRRGWNIGAWTVTTWRRRYSEPGTECGSRQTR